MRLWREIFKWEFISGGKQNETKQKTNKQNRKTPSSYRLSIGRMSHFQQKASVSDATD